MWQPGFSYQHTEPARLAGRHRAFCMSSIHYRGTSEKPGLVLGLAPGGSCLGQAFLVPASQRLETIAYLRARELVSYVYVETLVSVQLPASGNRVHALTYVADPNSPQFVGDLDPADQARIIATAHGRSGSNVDYLRRTIDEMTKLGLRPGRLGQLLERVEKILAHPHLE